MQEIKIFISSPGDVQAERGMVGQVIERLQGDYWNFVRLEAVLWEYEATRAAAHFNEEIIAPADCDIVLAFLWTRLGSRMPPQFIRVDGSRFESGTEWEIVTALEAYGRTGRPDVMVYRHFEQPPLPDDPARRAEAEEQRGKLRRFWTEWFEHPDRTVRRSFVAYDGADALAPRLTEQLRKLIHRRLPASVPAYDVFRPAPLPPGSPFRGLHAFGFEDAPLFFGRSRAIAGIARQLQAQAARPDAGAFVLVLGGSGAGKSSLARAGVAARLTTPNTLSGVDLWRCADCHPAAVSGQTPLAALAAVLAGALPELAAQELGGHVLDASGLAEKMADPEWLVLLDGPLSAALAAACGAGGKVSRLFLVVDQLEELFTDKTTTDAQREAFVKALAFLAGTRSVWIVATMRSEFFARAIELPALRLLMRGEGSYSLLPPDAGEISQIVRYPAAAANLHFERHPQTGESVADAIQAEATRDTRALPLLEFLLQDLYEHRDANNVLLWDRYEAVGKLSGALVSHADAAYARLGEDSERAALDQIFLALVTMDDHEQAVPTRNRAPRAALERIPGGARALEVFIDARLFVTDAEEAVPVVSLAHEALLAHWPYLQEFVRVHAALLRARRRLADLCNRWREKADYDPRGAVRLLLDEGSLAEAQEVVRFNPPDLTESERDFVARSQRKARARVRRLRAAVAVFAALAVAASAAGVVAVVQRKAATEQRTVAQAREREAREQRAVAQAREAEALEANRKFKAQLHAASLADTVRAQALFDQTQWRQGVAHLARALQYDPDNRLAGELLWNELLYGQGQRDPLPRLALDTRGPVDEVIYSPDGRRLATARLDEQTGKWFAQQWDADTGQPIGEPLEFAAPEQPYVSPDSYEGNNPSRFPPARLRLAYRPDGKCLATVCGKTVQQWDALTGQSADASIAADTTLGRIAYRPDGARLLAVDGKQVRQWDTRSGKPAAKPLALKGDSIFDAAYSPDGKRIVTGGSASVIQWDAATGEDAGASMDHEDAVVSVAYSPDGTRILSGSRDKTARQWDAATGKPVGEPLKHGGEVTSAAYSPDGLRILTASGHLDQSNEVRQWDAATGRPFGEPWKHSNEVSRAVYSPDGLHLATACADGRVRQWEANDLTGWGACLSVGRNAMVQSVVYRPDGGRLLSVDAADDLRQWQTATGEAVKDFRPPPSWLGRQPVYRPDGRCLLTVGIDRVARQWDPDTGQPVGEPMQSVPPEEMVVSAHYRPDGARIVTASEYGAIQQWDASGKAVGEPLRLEGKTVDANYSPDGARLVVRFEDGSLRQWDAATGQPAGEPMPHPAAITQFLYNPARDRILTSCEDRFLRQWDAATGRPVGEPIPTDGITMALTYDLDGTRIAAVLYTPALSRVTGQWDAATGRPLGGHPLPFFNGASYRPDGKRFAIRQDDNCARQWDTFTGSPFGAVLPHDDVVTGVAYSPDGTWLAGLEREVVRQWSCGCPPPSPPEWVDGFLRMLSGCRFNGNGELQDLTEADRLELRARLPGELGAAPAPPGRDWLALARWCLSEVTARHVSPDSARTSAADAEEELLVREDNVRAALRRVPDVPLGHLALAAYEPDPARAEFLRRYELARLPGDASHRAQAAAMLRAQLQPARAVEIARQALEADPHCVEAVRQLAGGLDEAGQGTGAVAVYDRLLASPDATEEDLFNAGYAAARLGRGEAARALFERARKTLSYVPPELLCTQGWALIDLHAPAEALPVFEQCDKEHATSDTQEPQFGRRMAGLIVSRWLTGDKEAAVYEYERLIINGNIDLYGSSVRIMALPWPAAEKRPLVEALAETARRRAAAPPGPRSSRPDRKLGRPTPP